MLHRMTAAATWAYHNVVWFAMCVLIVGCNSSDSERIAAATVRDSAGIQIVENVGPVETASTISTAPSLRIGSEEGASEYQLYKVRGATRLSNGEIVVFSGGGQELNYFDASGAHIRREGGIGEGPGEYRNVTWLGRLPNDSLVLFDRELQRLTTLSPREGVAGVTTLATASRHLASTVEGRVQVTGAGQYRVHGRMSDGSYVASSNIPPPLAEPGATVARDSAVYVRFAPNGSVSDTIGTFAADERQASASGAQGEGMILIGPPPFGRTSHVLVDATGFWFSSSDRYELQHYRADGRLDRIVRRSVQPVRVTRELAAAAKQADLALLPTQGPAEMIAMLRQMTEQKWDSARMPETLPAHGELMTDGRGGILIAETPLPGDTIARWIVFDAEGRVIRTIALPSRFRAMEFGADYVLGVTKDENDVESVELYRLDTL